MASSSSESEEEEKEREKRADGGNAAGEEQEEKAAPTQEQVQEVMAEIPSEVMDVFRAEWDALDADGSGYIEGREFYALLRKLYRPSDAEVDGLLERFDVDGDGELDYDEFKAAMASVNPRFAERRYRKQLKKLFRWHDADGDGVLSGRKELKTVIQSMLTIPERVASLAWLLYDRDGDRRVSFDEFVVTTWRLQASLNALWGFHGVRGDSRRSRTTGTVLARTTSGKDVLAELSKPDEVELPPSYFTAALETAKVGYKARDGDHVYARGSTEQS